MPDEQSGNPIVPFEWAIKDVAQPTLKQIGLDLKDGYIGLKKIISNAVTKSDNNGVANNRVMIEALRSGSFVDSDIGVEYFGGILASTKSVDGKDDSSIYYLDIIKSMSSRQLYLHYAIYRSLNKFLISDNSKENLNVALNTELNTIKFYISSVELTSIGLKLDIDLEALYRKGLLHEYKYDTHIIDQVRGLPYIMITPTTLGIQLFCIANNMLSDWRNYPKKDFFDFKDIELPKFIGLSVEDLLKQHGVI